MRSEILGVTISAINETLPKANLIGYLSPCRCEPPKSGRGNLASQPTGLGNVLAKPISL